MNLLDAGHSSINSSDFHPLEDQQHHLVVTHQEGRRPQRTGSPRGGREDPPPCSPASTASASGIYSIGREHPSGRHLEVSVHPGLAPLTQGLQPDPIAQGSPSDRPLRLSPVGPDKEILRLERFRQTGSDRRPQPKVGLQPGLPLPSHSPSQEGGQEVGNVQGDVSPSHPVLGCPDMVRLSPSAGSGRRSPSPNEPTSSSTS
jgi:hypothetical protein